MLLLRGGQVPVPTAVPLQRSEPETDDESAGDATTAERTNGAQPGSAKNNRPDPADPAAPAGVAAPAVATSNAAKPGVAVNSLRRLALTERELQVLRGMADGKSNAEIGRELFVSEDTVKTHARRLFRKLSARDRAHAVAAAFRAGLVR
jgi:DNA-binding NarL/FixJ family response regulator